MRQVAHICLGTLEIWRVSTVEPAQYVLVDGKYINQYHSELCLGLLMIVMVHKYTIGVLVIKPCRRHFASRTSCSYI